MPTKQLKAYARLSVDERIEAYVALQRYLAWSIAIWRDHAEVAQAHFFRPREERENLGGDEAARGGALLAYAYASLVPVLEGWDHLELRDERVDALVYTANGEPHQYSSLLRRYRNAAFHYQLTVDDGRFDALMLEHNALVWAGELRRELIRFFAERDADRSLLDTWLMEGSPPWSEPE